MIGASGLFNKAAWGEAFKNIDRPSNALQGLFVDGTEGLKRGWGHEKNYDFEQLWDEELQKKSFSERKGLRDGSLERASYIGSGALNLLLDPINFTGLGSLFKGLKATKTAAGNVSPIGYVADRAMLSEMPNRLETLGIGFYDKGLASKALTSTTGAVEGVLKSINRELNPTMLKEQKLFKKEGIPTTTTSVVDDTLTKLHSPEMQTMATNIANKAPLERTGKEKKFLKDWENLGKILQGQLGWNYLEKDAYKLATGLDNYKNTHFLSTALPLNKASFIQGAKQFDEVADDSYKLSDDILEAVFDKIVSVQNVTDLNKSKLYFKNPAVSNANAVRIANEVAAGSAKKRKLAGQLFVDKKPFKNMDELSEVLSKKEWESPIKNWKGEVTGQKTNIGIDHTIIKGKDGKEYAMFTDTYLSGDNLLGGVNVVNVLTPEGKIFSFVNDSQDIFKFKFPAGQTPIVATPPLVADFTGKVIKKIPKTPSPDKTGMMLGGRGTSSMSRPSVSPQLYESAKAIQELQKNIHLNPLDYLSYVSKVNIASEPFQD